MRLLGIAVLSLSLLFSCAPACTTAEPAAAIQEAASEATEEALLPAADTQEITVSGEANAVAPVTDTGASAGPDIRYLLLLQDFRSSIHDALTPFTNAS